MYEIHFRARREECGLTQAEVCETLGHSAGLLSKLENGLGPPRITLLLRLARLYHCHPWDFFTFHHFPPPRLLREWCCAACGSPALTPKEHP